jgi:hypothetical protein
LMTGKAPAKAAAAAFFRKVRRTVVIKGSPGGG